MISCSINGRFLAQSVTGVQRYAREVILALDNLLERDAELASRFSFCVLAPGNAALDLNLKKVSTRFVGNLSGHLWEQFELPRALRDTLLLNFANTGPIRADRQIVTIHDASVFAAPVGYSLLFRMWYKYLHKRLSKRAAHVVTDSLFSKKELIKYCGIDDECLSVVSLGSEHVCRFQPDESILGRHGLKRGMFVLAAGSLNPNKNLAILCKTAEELESRQFVLAVAGGENERVFRSSQLGLPQSVKYLGYVSDSELRALYESAACFVFPSRYEGFGLPPLEALACGCPVVVSNAASLPEVCGDAAIYVDPSNEGEIAKAVLSVVTDSGMAEKLRAAGTVRAASFRWSDTARHWLTLIERFSQVN